ncbi:DUF1196 domain-containing protein, partial [Vibrio cholerae]|nr:DUF1196 domain-containing protein [Vibrio cholerae]
WDWKRHALTVPLEAFVMCILKLFQVFFKLLQQPLIFRNDKAIRFKFIEKLSYLRVIAN